MSKPPPCHAEEMLRVQIYETMWSDNVKIFKTIVPRLFPITSVLSEKTGGHCLHVASGCGCLEIIQYLLETAQFDPEYTNSVDKFGRTPLSLSIYARNSSVFHKLLENGAVSSLYVESDYSSRTVLPYLYATGALNTDLAKAECITPFELAKLLLKHAYQEKTGIECMKIVGTIQKMIIQALRKKLSESPNTNSK